MSENRTLSTLLAVFLDEDGCQTLLPITAEIMAGKVQGKKHVQLSLESARKPERTHGGWRPKDWRRAHAPAFRAAHAAPDTLDELVTSLRTHEWMADAWIAVPERSGRARWYHRRSRQSLAGIAMTMRMFRVQLAGTRFRKTVAGATGTYGFYANRFVTADNAADAERMAISSIATREDLRDQLDGSVDAPSIIVENTVEWDKPVPGAEQQGLVWYRES